MMAVLVILAIVATMATLEAGPGEMADQVTTYHPGFKIIFRWLLGFLLVLAGLCYCLYLDA